MRMMKTRWENFFFDTPRCLQGLLGLMQPEKSGEGSEGFPWCNDSEVAGEQHTHGTRVGSTDVERAARERSSERTGCVLGRLNAVRE